QRALKKVAVIVNRHGRHALQKPEDDASPRKAIVRAGKDGPPETDSCQYMDPAGKKTGASMVFSSSKPSLSPQIMR
ncbi:MAG TPA: hypothetical protein PK261_09345, partial [Accumulibacter sp.]|nr:hypothetical protein [Accumulibacter sp.]